MKLTQAHYRDMLARRLLYEVREFCRDYPDASFEAVFWAIEDVKTDADLTHAEAKK